MATTTRPTMVATATYEPTAWRTRDIVVTAIIAVAFGVVFQVWNTLWAGFDAVFVFWPPAKDLLYGVWLVPAVLAPAIVRKPGAALFAELVAAGVSVLFGSPWGPDTLLSGFVQGAGAELIFAFTLYRTWSFPVLAIAAIASSVAAWLHDWVVWNATVATDVQLLRGGIMAISAVVIVALGSVLLVRALRRAGVLDGFPAG
jgi:energy-coupling factor transport system substrate-specific component